MAVFGRPLHIMRILFAMLVLTGLGSFILQGTSPSQPIHTAKANQAAAITKPAVVAATPVVAPPPAAQADPAPDPTPPPPVDTTPAPEPVPVVYSNADLMAQAGIDPGDYGAVDYIVSHESGWRYWAINGEGSGATGLCQALPGNKMASAGDDWATNPVTQLRWCNSYAQARYGGWWAAQAYWVAHRNW